MINFNPRFKEILKPFLSSLGSYGLTQNPTCVSPKQRLITCYKKVKRLVDILTMDYNPNWSSKIRRPGIRVLKANLLMVSLLSCFLDTEVLVVE